MLFLDHGVYANQAIVSKSTVVVTRVSYLATQNRTQQTKKKNLTGLYLRSSEQVLLLHVTMLLPSVRAPARFNSARHAIVEFAVKSLFALDLFPPAAKLNRPGCDSTYWYVV